MKPDLKFQLHRLDQAVFSLLDERARLIKEIGAPAAVPLDDILSRHSGTLQAATMRKLATAIDEAYSNEDASQ